VEAPVLREGLLRVATEYARATQETFAGHSLERYIRLDLPRIVQDACSHGTQLCTLGSAGKGNWASVPWVALLEPKLTSSAHEGFYVVYLFRAGMDGLYLSLNQGVTGLRSRWGEAARRDLQERGGKLRTLVPDSPSQFDAVGRIDLDAPRRIQRPRFYESASVIARYYPMSALPQEAELRQDLDELVVYYEQLVAHPITGSLFRAAPVQRADALVQDRGIESAVLTAGREVVFEIVARAEGRSLRVSRLVGETDPAVRIGWYGRSADGAGPEVEEYVDIPHALLADLVRALERH